MKTPAKHLFLLFAFLAAGSVLAAQGWVELPVREARDGVVYVTHYVSSDGMRAASPDEPGRVRNYSVCYDETIRQPLWVACPMHPWYDGLTERKDKWAFDPYVPRTAQADLRSSYKSVGGNGSFSRGHLVASADRLRSPTMNAQTFYFTNMAPQTQNTFNGGIWRKLEAMVRDWAGECPDTLYVVSGSAFIGPCKETSDRSGGKIPVPTHFYKVLLSSKSGDTGRPVGELDSTELRCTGFWFPHFGHAGSADPTAEYMKSVAEIEELTGISFFPMLSEKAGNVKKHFDEQEWGL